ncbi:uncharacterized protein B0H64DRAFT_388632 [Chaetomium fimeti]|uniref:Chromo domain-containing protein n=1 Tax=Chaetomium fimeti TaxID=1854472 RepID=A0AAE0HMZ8_9PEZI|nr:hypothetical protein B0H64DRAFT_388632 [Chaetomium fimeti]
MQLTVAPESSAALTADGTIRCLLSMRYPLPSRHSSDAIAFARQSTEELARAIPAQLGPPPVPSPAIATDGGATSTDSVTSYTADVQLHGVLLDRNRLLVCFDLFLHDCKPEVRRQVDESLARPIHAVVIHESGDGYRISGNPALDARVAQRYAEMREDDWGPRPYFNDSSKPSLYINGIRFEGSLEEYEAAVMNPDEAWDDGEEWEAEGICGHRTAQDGILEVRMKWKSGRETWERYTDVAQNETEALEEYERLHGRVTADNV